MDMSLNKLQELVKDKEAWWSWARSFPNPNNSLHKDLTVMLGKENIPDASQAVLHNISS